MAHQIFRLLESLYNTPHLITQDGFDVILQYLNYRNTSDFLMGDFTQQVKQSQPDNRLTDNKVGEIKIDGALTYKPVAMMCAPEGTSYQGILTQARDLINIGAKTILLTHSSTGGQAAHVFDTARSLRQMADENGVKLISYIDTVSASASLALQVISDEVIIHPEASTGSIGCVCALYDTSKRMEMQGIKPIYISSTKGKTPFQADGSFREDFLNKLQEDVTLLGMQFAEHVSEFTGISVDEILALDAQMFTAEKALQLNLVNKIMTHNQFYAYLKTL